MSNEVDLNKLYIKLFNRNIDDDGLRTYSRLMKHKSLKDIEKILKNSEEYKSKTKQHDLINLVTKHNLTCELFEGNVAIFSHYATQKFQYVNTTLSYLSEYFDTICILTNDVSLFEGCCHNVFHVDEKCDFNNVRAWLCSHILSLKPTKLCVCNDSFVIDINIAKRLKTFISDEVCPDVDLIGLTDSYQHSYHIQAYFMVFNTCRAIRSFVYLILSRNLYSKESNIDFEILISKYFLQKGYKFYSLYNVRNRAHNCCAYEYREVYITTGIIKRQHFLRKYGEFNADLQFIDETKHLYC